VKEKGRVRESEREMRERTREREREKEEEGEQHGEPGSGCRSVGLSQTFLRIAASEDSSE
jgi:hypothetical protein